MPFVLWSFQNSSAQPYYLGNALLTPTVSSLLTTYAPKDTQGKILGTNQSVGSLARVVGPAVGGAVTGCTHILACILVV